MALIKGGPDFRHVCRAKGLPMPEAEHKFHPVRRWRMDWAWPEQKVALEVDGGVWIRGKHGRGSGIVKDHEKQAHAAALGWRIIRVEPKHLMAPSTFEFLRSALAYRVTPVED
jgi:hypothetical protein